MNQIEVQKGSPFKTCLTTLNSQNRNTNCDSLPTVTGVIQNGQVVADPPTISIVQITDDSNVPQTGQYYITCPTKWIDSSGVNKEFDIGDNIMITFSAEVNNLPIEPKYSLMIVYNEGKRARWI